MSFSNAEKIAQLDRILRSQALQSSESLRTFLRYVALKTIEGEEGQLKEYVIATEVFGRSSDYDPKSESVVRVQASRLRGKLHEYYLTEGKNDPIFVELPKGHYIPVFSNFERNEESSAPSASSAIAAAPGDEFSLISPLWGDILKSSEPCLVVFSNTLFEGSAESGMKLYKPLNAPGSNSGSLGIFLTSQGQHSIVEHYTGIGETMGIYLLSEFLARINQPFRVKRSLLATWEDLKTEHIIALGSPAENFFLRELPQKQDFIFQTLLDENGNETFGIANLNPLEGERQFYLAKQEGPSRSQISRDYALISVLQGLAAKKRIMILAGITTYGTQAAAEYVTRPDYINDLIACLNIASQTEPPKLPASYQILVEVKVNDGVPIQVAYVTHHVL